MPRDPRAYLWDVREAAADIGRFVSGLDVQAYASTAMVHAAVERKFEVIGEALWQLAKLDPVLAARVPNLLQIVAFRNQLIHGYAAVSHSTVWNIIQGALPGLRLSVQTLRSELGDD